MPASPLKITTLVIGTGILLLVAAVFLWPEGEPVGPVETAPQAQVRPPERPESRQVPATGTAPTTGAGTAKDTVSRGWREVDPEGISGLPRLREDVAEAADVRLLEFDRDYLASLAEGDVMALAVPQLDQQVQIRIESVETLASGNASLRGHIDGDTNYSFVLTLAEKSVYATLGTREGVFNVRGGRQYAWIVPARAFNHHVDPNVPDYRRANGGRS